MKAKFKIRSSALFRGGRVRGMAHKCVSIVRHCSAFSRRCGAFLCAVLLVAHLAFSPVRARATAGALAAAGAAVTVSAFLMACGIYPYVTEEGQSFGEWGAQSLYDLWAQYVETLEAPPNGGTTQEAFNNIKSFIVDGTLAVASGTWGVLRDFAGWIVDRFTLADNQTDVSIGQYPAHAAELPVLATMDATTLSNSGKLVFVEDWSYGYGQVWYGALSSGLYAVATPFGGSYEFQILSLSRDKFTDVYFYRSAPHAVGRLSANSQQVVSYGEVYCYNVLGISLRYFSSDFPVYSSVAAAISDIFGTATNFEGIHADTVDVSVPDSLPANTPYGGLSVPGAGVSPTATAVKDVIETGVTSREKPVVKPVSVELGDGVTVDSETGQVDVIENPTVIESSDIPLTVSDYALPASITTVFPFSLPWDFARILEALRATPEPISLTLSFPHYGLTNGTGLTDEDFSFQVVFPPPEISQNETFSDFMSWFRNIELIVMCVAATWGIVSFIRRG